MPTQKFLRVRTACSWLDTKDPTSWGTYRWVRIEPHATPIFRQYCHCAPNAVPSIYLSSCKIINLLMLLTRAKTYHSRFEPLSNPIFNILRNCQQDHLCIVQSCWNRLSLAQQEVRAEQNCMLMHLLWKKFGQSFPLCTAFGLAHKLSRYPLSAGISHSVLDINFNEDICRLLSMTWNKGI
jgi:hypothetical protein